MNVLYKERNSNIVYRCQNVEEVDRNWVVLHSRDHQVDIQLQHAVDAFLYFGLPPMSRTWRQQFSKKKEKFYYCSNS